MNAPARSVSMAKPIAIAALLALAITLARLWGETHGGSQTLFNSEPGGPLAIVGINWLIPFIGIWFGFRLKRGGDGPPSLARALMTAVVGVAIVGGGIFLANPPAPSPAPIYKIALIASGSLVGGLVVFSGWKRLGRALLVYAYLAHIPVLVVTYVAMQHGWNTHYEKGMPGLPEMEFTQKFLVIGALPQLVTWIGSTLAGGGLFGAIASIFARAKPATG